MDTKIVAEKELLIRAAAGDNLAVQQLLFPHIAHLSRIVADKYPRLDFGMVSVDDIVQETLGEAYRHIREFDPEKGSLRNWLATIAERRARNAVRAQQRIKRGGDFNRVDQVVGAESSLREVVEILSAGSHTASRSAVRHEAVQAVQDAIDGLREEYRQAVQMRLIQGMSLDEVAKIMNRSPRSVQGLVDRAKKVMRQALGRLSKYE